MSLKLSKRTSKAFLNILGLFGLKGINVLISFLLVPITLGYLDPVRYGLWITLSGIFNWFSLFDIGLGNGLRFKLAESLANENKTQAKIYISTTYAALSIIFGILFILFTIANQYIEWHSILNTSISMEEELKMLAQFVFLFFCIRFVTQLISVIALANQEPAFAQFLDVIGRIIAVFGIYLLTKYKKESLLYMGIILTALPVLTTLIASFISFKSKYKNIQPGFKFIRFIEIKKILNLGIKYFIIQIAAIIFYQTNNLIITQIVGPEAVTDYSIAFQLFSIITIIFLTILTPYWSAFTDAFTRNDFDWIKKVMRNLKLIWGIMLLLTVILYFASDFIIKIWIGKEVNINKELYLTMAIYIIVNALNAIYSYFLNGVGRLNLQLYSSVIFAIVHIPLALYFGKQFGVNGIMFSTIFFALIQIIIFHIQYNMIITKVDKGIWSK